MRAQNFLLPLLALLVVGGLLCARFLWADVDLTPVSSPTTEDVAIRGLGKLAVSSRLFGPEGSRSSWITITAEDSQHATICGSKFLADYTHWGPIKVVTDTKLPGTVLHLDGAGWWVLGLDAGRFQVLFSPTPEGIAALARKASAEQWRAIPPTAYPRWLDCFDNASYGFWVHGGGVLTDDLPADLEWLSQRGFTACFAETTEQRLIAPGVLDTATMDWEDAISRKYNLPYRTLMSWGSTMRPSWLWNWTPLPHVMPLDGYHPYGDLGHQQFASYNVFEPTPATDPYQYDLRRRMAGRMGQYDNFIGHHGTAELGSAGLSELAVVGGNPEIQNLWHSYLKDKLGYDLAEAGRRFQGDPGAYKSWDDVKIPLLETISGMDATSIDLRGIWEGRPDPNGLGAAAGWFKDAGSDDWHPVDCNEPMIAMYAEKKKQGDQKLDTTYWLRRHLTATQTQADTLKYLHLSRPRWHAPSGDVPTVYLNGQELKMTTNMNPVRSEEELCYDVGPDLHAGDNQIVINPHGMAIPSYIFLAQAGPWIYPGPNPRLNRQFFDAVNFEVWLRAHQLENILRAMRADEPYRPIKLMAPSNYLDEITDLCDRYGAYLHDTGQAGAIWAPWPARYGMAHHQPTSSEPGGPADSAATLQQFTTFYLMLGNSAVDIVFHPSAYRKNAEITTWVDQNIELMRCVGKMQMEPPAVGVLRSNRDAGRLKFDGPWAWDLTRGELQGIGRTCNYADLPDVLSGRIDHEFKVLFDDGTAVLTDQELAGLERYVRQGGIFVALHNTGMNTPEEANAWPISRLTGLRVVNRGEMTHGELSFRPDEDLWPKLAGRKITENGLVLDWQKRDVTGNSIGMEAEEKDIHIVAEWAKSKDDHGNIAVAYRNLGKGKVVTLGSPFWRRAHDESGAYQADDGTSSYLDELLNSLGVPRESWRTGGDDTEHVFVEHWRSKNGVFDLYPVAYVREHAKGPLTFDASWRRSTPVTSLMELSALGFPSRPVTWKDGVMTMAQVQLDTMQSRVFAAPRSDIEQSPLYWLKVQSQQWPVLEPIPEAEKAPLQPLTSDILPLQDGWTMETGAVWPDTLPGAATASDKTVKLGTFLVLGLPEDAVAHFRKTVHLPEAWAGQRISLHFDAEHWFWGIRPHGRLWVNGQPAPLPVTGDQEASFSFDVTPAVGRKDLEIALEVDGRVKTEAQRMGRPSGVTGTFYLQAEPQPVSMQALTDWQAATDLNVFQPVVPGQKATYSYLETKFTLPSSWPAPRLLLASDHLGWLVINGTVIAVPQEMNSLDISHLVKRDGENILRWLPGTFGREIPPPSPLRLYTQVVPELKLSWMP